MGLSSHAIEVLNAAGLPIWIVAGLILVGIIAHHGPKWVEVILNDRRQTQKILNEDKRKNEKHSIDIEEKMLKIEERKNKLAVQKAGKKP